MDPTSQVQVSVGTADGTADEAQTLELIRELRQIPGIGITRPKALAPDGSKAGLIDVVGTISIAVSSGAIAPVTTILYDWVKRRRQRCTMTAVISGVTFTFPEVEINEAMAMLKREGLQPDHPAAPETPGSVTP